MVEPQRAEKYARLLSNVDLFSGLDRVSLSKLAAHLESRHVPSGETLLREGDAADAFYLIADGALGVFVTPKDGLEETRIQTLGAGDPVGEMALLTNSVRSATVRADADSEVLRLERAKFMQLARQEPSVSLAIAATLSRRLRDVLAQAGAPEAASGNIAEATPTAAPKTAAVSAKRGPLGKLAFAALFAVVTLLAGWTVAPPSGLSLAGWHALVVLVAFLPALVVDALPEGIVAIALAAAWVVGGVVPAQTALSGFASPNWVLVVCVLAVGSAVAATGALYRMALWTVARFPNRFASQAFALGIAGLVMSPAVPNGTGRVIFVAPLIHELVEALGYKAQGWATTGLAMAALVGFGQMVAAFMTSSTTAVLVFALVQPAGAPANLNWLTWAVYALPTTVIIFFGAIGAIVWLYRPAKDGAGGAPTRRPQSLDLQRTLLGPPSRAEKFALATSVALLAGFITQPWHGVHPAWIGVAALVALAAARVATADTMRTINWSFALLFGILASMGDILASLGVDKWLATHLAGFIGPLADSPVLFVAALTVLCFAVGFVVRWQAAAPLITIVFAPLAHAAGINPLVVGLVATIACNLFVLPYQSTIYLALYHGTGGKLFTHAGARPAALAYATVVFAALCASVPVWHLMGLL